MRWAVFFVIALLLDFLLAVWLIQWWVERMP